MITPSPLRQATSLFHDRFASRPGAAASAPGRINLIGEHIDYNGGPVLPFAIERRTAVVGSLAEEWHVASTLDSTLQSMAPHDPKAGSWNDFPRAVARVMTRGGLKIPGARLAIASALPPGAGLSSSAALTLATARVLAMLGGLRLETEALIDIAYRAEHDELGIPCGRMDQTIIGLGVKDSALLIDFACGRTTHVPLHARVWVFETGVRHSLAASQYPVRRRECEEARRYLADHGVSVAALCHIPVEHLAGVLPLLPPPLDRRVRHCVTEAQRTRDAAEALRLGDLPRLGGLMNEGHESLLRDYESSCAEADHLVETISRFGGLGARLTGGGWGGAVVALLPERDAARIVAEVGAECRSAWNREPAIWPTRAVEGVRREQVP